jgi:biotin carboxylase
MKKTLFIFGTTYNQIPLVEKAEASGYMTVCLGTGGGVCEKYADKVYPIDFTDIEEVLRLAKIYQPAGMVTCGTSTAIHAIAQCNHLLKFSDKVPPLQVVENCVFKNRYRDIIGESMAPGFSASDPEKAVEMVQTLRLPVVVKPADGGGGKGISLLEKVSLQQMQDAFQHARSYSKMNTVVVEEFIDGTVLGVESFVHDGKIFTLVMPEKLIDEEVMNLTRGVVFPANFSAEIADQIRRVNEAAIRAFGINWGAVHIDMILERNEVPRIIDVGPRLAGGPLMAEMVPRYYNYDFYKATIQLSVGEQPLPVPDQHDNQYYASYSLVPDKDGILESVEYEAEAVDACRVFFYRQLLADGSSVKSPKSDGDRVVLFASTGENYQQTLSHVMSFASGIRMKIR